MPFRSRRRPRSISEPCLDSAKRTHTLIVQLSVSEDTDKDEALGLLIPYIKGLQESSERLPSTFELRRFMQSKYGPEDPEWVAKLNLVMDSTRQYAENWIMGESIDAALMHRSSSPKPVMDVDSYKDTNKIIKCCVCQTKEKKSYVELRACGCVFHKHCIEKAYGFSTFCPICTMSIDDYPVVHELDDYIDHDCFEVLV
jgi:hypothetical protein